MLLAGHVRLCKARTGLGEKVTFELRSEGGWDNSRWMSGGRVSQEEGREGRVSEEEGAWLAQTVKRQVWLGNDEGKEDRGGGSKGL